MEDRVSGTKRKFTPPQFDVADCVVFLQDYTIEGLLAAVSTSSEFTGYNRHEWRAAFPMYRDAAKAHPLYPIRVHGFTMKGRKDAHTALLRIEAILDWIMHLDDTEGLTEEVLEYFKTTGEKKAALRSAPKYSFVGPRRLPAKLSSAAVDRLPIYSAEQVLAAAQVRTMRVVDSARAEAWIVPARTTHATIHNPTWLNPQYHAEPTGSLLETTT